MSKEELKPIDVSKYTVTESGNVIKSEEKETTKEDFFRQNFSEYCRGGTFLSPYWDLFEAGYELKQNILSQHILELQADKGRLADKVKELEQENAKLKRCEICKHQSNISGCSYHSISVKDCKENGMKLFELKEIKEK